VIFDSAQRSGALNLHDINPMSFHGSNHSPADQAPRGHIIKDVAAQEDLKHATSARISSRSARLCVGVNGDDILPNMGRDVTARATGGDVLLC
jgi:hypothetical protein